MTGVPIAIISGLAWGMLGLSLIGSGYMLAAAITLRGFLAPMTSTGRRTDAVTILKPLHGAEPRLVAHSNS